MAISPVSFTKTPQAKADDFNSLTESNFEGSSGSFLLDVMANDLGGGGKSLYSIDDGDGPPQELLIKDSGLWETTLGGNKIRIIDGKVEYQFEGDVNALNSHETFQDSFLYAIEMGKGAVSYTRVTLSIQGQNDAASMTGDTDGGVTEDGDTTADGTLTVSDVDHGEAHAVAFTSTTDNGVFSVDQDGYWTYAADNGAIQHLAAGKTIIETFTVQSQDGTAHKDVTITITGVNDEASITGDITGSVTEDNATPATGTLTVHDVDDDEAVAVAASGTSTKGSYTVDAAGHWSFTANNAALQHLGAGKTDTATFTVSSLDGTAHQDVTITFTGVNDEASFGGDTGGDVAEDGQLTASGTLSVTDVDDGEQGFQDASNDDLQGTYGTFTFNSTTGGWSYALNNGSTVVQGLTSGSQNITDTLTIRSLDGTEQVITVNIAGADEPAPVTPTDTPPEPQGAAAGKKNPINYGQNFVNGVYVIKDAADTLQKGETYMLTGQITYVSSHYGDYKNDSVMDTYIDVKVKIGPDTHDATIILVGVSQFDPATQLS